MRKLLVAIGALAVLLVAPASSTLYTAGNGGSPGVDIPGANRPTPPNVGANFGSSGTFANYTLYATVPKPVAPVVRYAVRIQNLSTCPALVLQDDGTASAGSAPSNASFWVLNPAQSAGTAGTIYASPTDKGRDQVYVPSSCASTALITVHYD